VLLKAPAVLEVFAECYNDLLIEELNFGVAENSEHWLQEFLRAAEMSA